MDKIEAMKKWWKNKGYTVEVDHYMGSFNTDPCFKVSKDGKFIFFDVFSEPDEKRSIVKLREQFNSCWNIQTRYGGIKK